MPGLNGKAQRATDLSRDDLERHLVTKDKQAVITDCLKIFDTNTFLYEGRLINEKRITELSKENHDLRETIIDMEGLTWGFLLKNWFKGLITKKSKDES